MSACKTTRSLCIALVAFTGAANVTGCSEPDSITVPSSEAVSDNEDSNAAFSYAAYDELLKTYVDDEGYVDYKGLKSARTSLDTFVIAMGEIDPAAFAGWTSEERLALWINAYNAITLKYILDNYPLKKGGLVAGLRYPANSIRQISGVWDELATKVVGEEYVLEDIENEAIRKGFDEPRIHVAIVCASIGCPPLRNESFTAEKLAQQLEDQSRRFLADGTKFRIDRQNNQVHLSSIFKWFDEDFVSVYKTDKDFRGHNESQRAVLNFISHYVAEADAVYLRDAEYSIVYEGYDWSLNER